MGIASKLGRALGFGSEPVARVEPVISAAETDSSGVTRPAAWMEELGFRGTASRVAGLPPVSHLSAERHATVYACCNIIAADTAKVPLRVMQRAATGEEVEVADHPLQYLANVEASPGVPAAVVRYALAYAYTLRGVAFGFAPRDGSGEVFLLEAISPDVVTVLRDGRRRFYQFEDGARVIRRVGARSMVHMRYGADDGWTPRSPIAVASESVGLALAGQEAAARTAVGGTARATVTLLDTYESDDDRVRSAKRIKDALTDPRGGGFAVLNEGESVERLDLSAADQELLSSRKFDREQIAAIYRMPPSKLQMLEYGVKANGQQQALDYRADCLLHWARFLEAEYNLALLTEAERRAGLRLRHDFEALLQPTTAELFAAIKVATGGPFMTANEGRAKAGLGRHDDGDTLYPPSNMTRESAPTDGGDDD